ncbi:MAG: hypothetical protein J1E56_07075 [Ruminococcus sp.]|nr:hypothetical protein [Ruminococcus sp.]
MDNNNEFRQSEITYDEGWQSVSTPEYPQTLSDFDEETYNDEELQEELQEEQLRKPKKKRETPIQLLMIIQLVMCLLVCLVAYVLKNVGGDWYNTVHSWYETQLTNELTAEDIFKDADLTKLLTASNDEA